MDCSNFWQPWEVTASNFDEAIEAINNVRISTANGGNRQFAWRGQVDATWPMYSSHYRRLCWTLGATAKCPDEARLQKEETKTLSAVRNWGLHHGTRGRLSTLYQLAILQHYSAPTRLIDITFNPLIGLWFAVEKRYDNGSVTQENKDGRLFAVDVTDRLIDRDNATRSWEDATEVPWPTQPGTTEYHQWTTQVSAWRPARLDNRIAAQDGGFIFGGVPATVGVQGQFVVPKSPRIDAERWRINEIRSCISVALRVHKIEKTAGRVAGSPLFTIKIRAAAKAKIREELERRYGYRHDTLFPDYPGFASFSSRELKTRP